MLRCSCGSFSIWSRMRSISSFIRFARRRSSRSICSRTLGSRVSRYFSISDFSVSRESASSWMFRASASAFCDAMSESNRVAARSVASIIAA